MTRRLHLWWRAAIAVAATLTTPRVASATSDQAFVLELRNSRLFGVCHTVSAMLRRGWADAWVNRRSAPLRAGWAALPAPARVRHVAGAIATGGFTALALGSAGPSWIGSLTWVLPLALALAGTIGLIAAEPLARAMRSKAS